jgi:hypothetical protein
MQKEMVRCIWCDENNPEKIRLELAFSDGRLMDINEAITIRIGEN